MSKKCPGNVQMQKNKKTVEDILKCFQNVFKMSTRNHNTFSERSCRGENVRRRIPQSPRRVGKVKLWTGEGEGGLGMVKLLWKHICPCQGQDVTRENLCSEVLHRKRLPASPPRGVPKNVAREPKKAQKLPAVPRLHRKQANNGPKKVGTPGLSEDTCPSRASIPLKIINLDDLGKKFFCRVWESVLESMAKCAVQQEMPRW